MAAKLTPTKAAAEAEAKAAAEVRQIHDIDVHYIRQKHSWYRSAPPIDVQGAFMGSPFTFRWVRTNADTEVFTIIDVQGALTGSPVTFQWVRTKTDADSLAERMRSLLSPTSLTLPTSPAQANLGRTVPTSPVSNPIDVQGALPGSPVTFRWVRTNTDAYSLALKPSHWQSTMPHGEPHRRRINNLMADAWTVNAVWVTALPTYRESTPLHEFRHCHMSSLIAGRPTTSSQTLALSSSSPSLPISNLLAWLSMTEALPSISWKPDPPLPPEAAHLDLQASLTLPTLSATPTKSAIPNQGLPTSTPLTPYGRPIWQHRHHHRRRDKIIAGTQKTPLPTSAPSMLYGRPFCQHLHHHRRRDTLITDTTKTSSLTSAPSMPYGRPCCQHLNRQL